MTDCADTAPTFSPEALLALPSLPQRNDLESRLRQVVGRDNEAANSPPPTPPGMSKTRLLGIIQAALDIAESDDDDDDDDTLYLR